MSEPASPVAAPSTASPIQRSTLKHRGLTLSYLDTAPGDHGRPVVLFIHGFPDTAMMWTVQMTALHAAGYRCIAPDTVGCGESDMAATLGDYDVATLIEAPIALLDHLRLDRVDIVGHDWGAVQAWMIAGRYPQRVRRLVAISVGHPMAYARAGWDQKKAGWYILFFQLAGLAERLLLGAGRFSMGRVFTSHPHMDEVIQRLAQPGRLTAALRIYRASLATALLKKQSNVQAPTLGIWSTGDRFLVESQMRDSRRYVDGPWTFLTIDGGHWIPLEHPEWTTQQLLKHFAS